MHYKGLLRVVRRDNGIRIYAAQQHGEGPASAAERRQHIDALVDAVVNLYAPVPAASLSFIIRRLRYAAPHWQGEFPGAIARARARLAHAAIAGHTWYWPADDTTVAREPDGVTLLAPFDPVVWDRRRFELLWGWAYRFEAYTPAPKRQRGYYALPLLWRDSVIGWANVSQRDGHMTADLGFVSGRAPRDRAFKQALDAEIEAMRAFLVSR
jgi:uncharacterized protein YcaQ